MLKRVFHGDILPVISPGAQRCTYTAHTILYVKDLRMRISRLYVTDPSGQYWI